MYVSLHEDAYMPGKTRASRMQVKCVCEIVHMA